NGVPPTETTGLVYSGPIRISGTTTIRAAAFRNGYLPSNVDTQTYIFLDDVIRQSATGAAPPGWPSSWGQNVVDYGMDPDVVNNPQFASTIKNDLKSIPSFSVVMNVNDLFNSTTGIYANPGQDGIAWERQCSLELIHPDGTEGFQANAGIRIRGGFSRSTSNPKHAFRFFFRGEYGDGKLNYPLFGDGAATEFDKIDLRTFQNYSWSFQGDGNGIFMRDQFSRDTQLQMGHHGERGDFFHLYINGQYWGLFNTCERPEAAYGESYYGGVEADYDTIKTEAGSYTINATDGNMNAWTTLYNLARAGVSTDAAYQRLLGNNPDGTVNTNYPVYIDPENLIDYMLIIFYTGNKDAPISNFLGNESPNNWYGLRDRRPESRMGFKFFAHDSEHTLLDFDLNIDRTGPFPAGDTSVSKSNPQWVFKQLVANNEFKLKVADRVHKYFFNSGLLTPEQNRTRLLRRKAEIDRAVVGESARWGDAKRATPFTRNDWQAAVDDVLNNFLPTRTQIVLSQLRADGLYPNVVAPSFNQLGGNVNLNFSLTMSAPAGQIYYTLDGTDPRLLGGAVSSKALAYSGPIILNQNAVVKARAFSGGVWSALNEANFNIIRTFKELLITEIMYNPPAVGSVDGDEFEFIELKNIGTTELDLSGIRFTNGIEYVFPAGTKLAGGAFYVLAENAAQFAVKYPNARIDGVYSGNLSNGGETLAVVHAAGALIQRFSYDDQTPWPATTDGTGFSLVPRVFEVNADYSNATNWRASAAVGGSPGSDDPVANIPSVVINEVLTHTDLPAVDAIELHNPTAAAVDVGGWYLTDDLNTPKKFRIPSPTLIQPGNYVVFDEDDFNKTPGVAPSFALSSAGDEVFLFSALADGNLSGYMQGFNFKGAENGVSFGRYTNSVGEVLYPAQLSLTLGTVNSGPRIGPVVINEIGYHPALTGDEFIELKNITTSTVKLYDPAFPTNTWRLGGVDYSFPPNTEIPPNGLIVISGVEPSAFKQHAGLPAQVTVVGPFTGNLQDNGESIEVLRPDAPELVTNEFGTVALVVPQIVIDAVRYSNRLPWPTNSSGTGNSIERMVTTSFGNDPQNWRSSPGTISPGLNNDGNRLPVVNAGGDIAFESATFPVTRNITGLATDDGLPNPPRALSYSWSQVSGPGVVQVQNANQASASFSFPGSGVFVLKLTVSDGEYSVSDELSVLISRPLAAQTLVAQGATWKYIDNGISQNSNWRDVDFPEAGWKTGAAPLGYGDPVTTTVSYGPSSTAKYTTTYLRHAFNVTSRIAGLDVRLRRDDGAIVYLNGTEVFRSNMPEGAVAYSTFASGVVGGTDETTFYSRQIDQSLIRSGKNVLAVELHQVSLDSTDLSFDLDLIAQVDFENSAPTANAGSDLVVQMPAAATLNGAAGDDGLPVPPGVFNASWSMVSGPGSVAFANANLPQTTATFSQAGAYVLRLSVTDGTLTTSDEVQVTVNGTTDPYVQWKQQNFTAAELSNPSISGDDADPDNDQVRNQDEYISGTRPKDGASYLHVADVEVDGDDFVIRFEAIGDKSYTILGRDNAGAGDWTRVLDLSPQGTTELFEAIDNLPRTNPKRFYRVITPQIPPQ
ncbi:MAG TPA: lamin tail domain-containing protein, partial [Candidatus Kapabacteria bacterium]|nr:lamin tail domain-containing protein [Candidatus Kapabacteria bacterium]